MSRLPKERPFYVYDNWSAYDELSDNIPLTEELALFQLEHMVRLRELGVTFDAYLMDAFWYERKGGYFTWKKERWPQGPDRWITRAKDAGLEAGLWFPANTAFEIEPPDSWLDSLSPDGWGFCCFHGGFMEGFLEVLRYWYFQGITVFKFDFADFGAAPAAVRASLLPSEIRSRNVAAYRQALSLFIEHCPDAKLLAYNGFEEVDFMANTFAPIRKALDPTWLDIFETVYCGDPRPADVAQPNFWRTLDIYADHMVRHMNLGGFPLDRIDNCSLMLGKAGTCYARGMQSWQTTAVLSLARKGRVHMTLGNLEQFSTEDAKFFAHYQRHFETVEQPVWEGGIPGKGEVYGYRSSPLLTLVNPGLQTSEWPASGTVLFSVGYVEVQSERLILGPGAVVVLDTEAIQESTFTGLRLSQLTPTTSQEAGAVVGEVFVPVGDLHFGFYQKSKGSEGFHNLVRTSGGAPPDGETMANLLRIEAWQNGKPLTVQRADDKAIWSGQSWAYGILLQGQIEPGSPVNFRFSSTADHVELIGFWAASC